MIVAQERYEHYSLPEEDRRTARRPRRGPLPRKGQVMLTGLVCIIFCTGIMIAFYYTQVLITGYKIYRLEKELVTLQQETNQLNEGILRLTSLDYVEKIATKKLGMVSPDNKNVVLVNTDLGANAGRPAAPGDDAEEKEPDRVAAEDRPQAKQRNSMLQAFVNLMGHIRG